MFERPVLLWLLIAAPLAAGPGVLTIVRGSKPLAGMLSAFSRLATFAALVLMLAGLRIPVRAAAHRMALVLAVDVSRSIAPDQQAWMRRQVTEISNAASPRDQVAVLGFGRDARLLSPPEEPRMSLRNFGGVDPNGTDIGGALTTALGIFPRADEKRLVLLTDGNETQGRVLDELPAMTQEGVRVFTAAPPPSAFPRVAITAFDAPRWFVPTPVLPCI